MASPKTRPADLAVSEPPAKRAKTSSNKVEGGKLSGDTVNTFEDDVDEEAVVVTENVQPSDLYLDTVRWSSCLVILQFQLCPRLNALYWTSTLKSFALCPCQTSISMAA